jgi:uncharacterized membrane protein HdeD (DUF308 family)
MKAQKDIYRAANKVRTTKTVVIILGVLLLIGAFVMFMESAEGWTAAIVMGIACFLTGGLLEGFAEIVDAACKYNNEPDTRINDSEVQ